MILNTGKMTTHRGPAFRASWFDLSFVVVLVAIGFIYLEHPKQWAAGTYLGNDQWGDADFWWQGALQLARGMLWNNVSITFRMGYAIFAGLSAAVVGPNYPPFHVVLTLVFLGVAATAYLALRHRVGRPVAIGMVAALVFSPAHAEFLAISTSDGLGLILNIAALTALILATRARSTLWFVVLTGIFLSLAGLTRPLMSLFIFPAALIIFVTTDGRFVRKTIAVVVLLCAFATPTLCWMTVLYAKTGVFALAGYDSSIFYAASTAKLQVWTPDMYPAVEEAAKKRLGTTTLTTKQLSDEFWYETLENYRLEWRYHLDRLGPSILRFADFNHSRMAPWDTITYWLRWVVRGGLGLVLIAGAIATRRWVTALLLAVATGLSIWPPAMSWLVVAIAAYFLLAFRGPAARPVPKIVSLYWLTGVVAIFLTGGVSKYMPTEPFEVNALGFRLGTQCFFANDWLILLWLGAIATPRTLVLPARKIKFLEPQPLPRALLAGAGALSLLSLFLLLSSGAVIAGWRGYKLATADREPFPSVIPVADNLCRAAGAGPSRVSQPGPESAGVLGTMWAMNDPSKRPDQTRIFTGSVGALLWRIEDEDRTRALFHTQTNVRPFIIGPERTDVEFEQLLEEDPWRNRQGMYVVRSFPDEASHRNIRRDTVGEVEVFVPLTTDGMSYDMAKIQRFPLSRYASIMTSKMTITGGTLEWWAYPTDDLRRWFIIQAPPEAPPLRDVAIGLDLSGTVGRRSLSFSFRVEQPPGYLRPSNRASFSVSAIGPHGEITELAARDTLSRGMPGNAPTELVNVDIPEDASAVQVRFPDVADKEFVRVIEFKLKSEDVVPTMVQQLCTDVVGSAP